MWDVGYNKEAEVDRSHESFQMVLQQYWDYYRELESELVSTRRYVDFVEDNFRTYSVEYLKLFQAACSEIDVIGKALARCVNPSFGDTKDRIYLHKWWYEVQDLVRPQEEELYKALGKFLDDSPLRDFSVTFMDRFTVQPWKGYEVTPTKAVNGKRGMKLTEGSSTPKWWSSYNKVKHQRISLSNSSDSNNYRLANLGNTIEAFAGLYSLELALLGMAGTKNDLESFIVDSALFGGGVRSMTTSEIDKLFE